MSNESLVVGVGGGWFG